MVDGEQTRITKVAVREAFATAAAESGKEFDPKELELADRIVDILYETELPKFRVTGTTSTSNDVVQRKAEILIALGCGIQLIPEYQLAGCDLQYNTETLKVAPWVNMIHAWMKVLNQLNTVSAMQRGEVEPRADVLAAVAHALYAFTTNADGDLFLRTDKAFEQQAEYVETIKRKAGTEGVNAQRHVCYGEMMYILDQVRNGFGKST